MEHDRHCPSCDVYVVSDLTNCPLCGKYIADGQPAKTHKKSYPIYNTKFVQTAKWYNIIKYFFWLAAAICLVINLIEPTKPYWFPYVLAALLMVFYVFIKPIKLTVKSYIKGLTIMSVCVAAFLIFVDTYNYYSFDTKFGWALGIAAPFVMLAGVLATAIVSFCYKRYEKELLQSVAIMGVLSIIYMLVVLFGFKSLPLWPSLALTFTSVGLVVVIEMFNRHRLIENLSHEFHI